MGLRLTVPLILNDGTIWSRFASFMPGPPHLRGRRPRQRLGRRFCGPQSHLVSCGEKSVSLNGVETDSMIVQTKL
jgi:hypothetical protein